VNAAGDRSKSTTVGDAPPPTGEPIINADNAQSVIAAALDVYSGNFTRKTILGLPGFSQAQFPQTLDGVNEIVCSIGGTATLSNLPSEGLNVETAESYDFDNCQDDSQTLDGKIEIGSFPATQVLADAFRLEYEPGLVELDLSGKVYYETSSRSGSSGTIWITDALDISLKGAPGGYAYLDSTTEYGYTFLGSGAAFQAFMKGGFTIREERAETQLQAQTLEPFSYKTDREENPDFDFTNWNFTSGVLSISAPDGSEVQLVAATDDPTMAEVRITYPGGSSTSEQPWSTWRDNLLIEGFTE